jgi:hypothetical protein
MPGIGDFITPARGFPPDSSTWYVPIGPMSIGASLKPPIFS